MNELLHELNRSLRALDEAHRLGEITRDDYRARRRALLAPLRMGGQDDARRSWLSGWRDRLTGRR